MTDTPAAFQATFSDFRLVKGRKQAQLVFEVPLENADAALKALGGVPRPDESRWFAIARLAPGAQAHEPGPLPAGGTQRETSRPERKSDSATFRAVMLCNNTEFHRWLQAWASEYGSTTEDMLRGFLKIRSRSEIDADSGVRRRFEAMEAQFLADTGRMVAPR